MQKRDKDLIKEMRRAAKANHRAKKLMGALEPTVSSIDQIDVACLIHANGYSWEYVENLHNMVVKNLSIPVRFHVYTELEREVPDHMIKHVLEEWPGVSGVKQSWWYKLQLFNTKHHQGNLLYFDLDTVIVNSIDWIRACDPRYFWALRDFKKLWKRNHQGMNSSVMWWNTNNFHWIWQDFNDRGLENIRKHYAGDQDYLTDIVTYQHRRFFDEDRAVSWRWQAHDGGMDMRTYRPKSPGSGTKYDARTSLLIFHGNPKPHQVQDPVIDQHWKCINTSSEI